MMVLFISRSEKKSIYTVRKILDNFADRVGNDTWKTVITEEGLQTVKIWLYPAIGFVLAVIVNYVGL